MLNENEILEQLKDILKLADDRNVGAEYECSFDSRLREDLGLASVGMLYMVISIEEIFDVSFSETSLNDFVTIRDVVDFIMDNQ